METIKDYLEKLEIDNTILNKQLADVDVTKIIYFKEERIIYIYLSSKNIISYIYTDMLREEIKKNLITLVM
ncbi:PolC-type DNA polymerase III N-terminal domain-containing protein [Paraclostridium sp. AKS73]|uniref:PolC-type DNA polymerase III N-terminal domain-containing protein n=1 Tax=Paraclostridium sp. AKS73 TaxID=2876116 RepID=UPI0021E0BEF0|nr:hypothetical protein [Paraclostridium sp. AKS73]